MAKILAFDQICSHENWEMEKMKIEAMVGQKLKGV
jgi:hypothetical protein